MGLVQIEANLIAKEVIPILQGYNEIVGAYHFGSSLNKCRPDSDIDIGVICDPKSIFTEKEYEKIVNGILNQLSSIDGHFFDITILNSTNSIFAFRVIKNGKIFYNKEPGAVGDFIEIVSREYAKNYPRYRAAIMLATGVQ